MRTFTLLATLAAVTFAGLSTATSATAEDEIGYVETFALAEDREKVLEQLIPGTEEYYFYHTLHYQLTGQHEALEQIMAKWRNRMRNSQLRDLIVRREQMLAYDENPQQTLAWLQRELNLHFSHQRDREPGQKPDLPTVLDPKLIDRDAFIERAIQNQDNLSQFQDSAFDWLLREGGVELTSNRRRALLSRLDRPDYDGLVGLVLADLQTKESRGFGEFPIHGQLLQAQLDQLVKKKPDLLNNSNFIQTYLSKLAPSADADPNDPEVMLAHLQRLWTVVSKLAPAHNSLKAHVLYALLDQQREAGNYDRQLFETYLQLPRPLPYMEPKFLNRDEIRRNMVNLNQDFAQVTFCPPIGDDTELVRDFLLHFLLKQDSIAPWDQWVRDTFLKPLLAEAKIVAGAEDRERWASMLSPAAYQELKDRVDIDLVVTNPLRFEVDDDVTLVADIKNVDKLLVKVYEINALNVYLATSQEVSTGLELDGLVAGAEQQYEYKETPFRRVRREFTFPELKDRRGVWMIEFIGGGRSSRALVRKGGLHYLSRPGVAGTVLTILDEHDQPVEGATAWLGGSEYKPDEHGTVLIPYSTSPGRRAMILRAEDGFASLAFFQHPVEKYTLDAGFFVDREALRVGGEALLLVRPDFRVNGVAAPLDILEQVKLSITSTNLDGVSTTMEVPNFELHADKESEYKLAVPPQLKTLSFQLSATVEQVSTGQKVNLAAGANRMLNEIDQQMPTYDLHLSWLEGNAVIEVLGKNGEWLSDRPVRFTLEHRDFKQPFGIMLKSDEAGRIDLGPLPGIVKVKASADGTQNSEWDLTQVKDSHSRPVVLNAIAGELLQIPHVGSSDRLTRADYSLLSNHGTFVADEFGKLSLVGGFLVIEGLEPGDYSLKIKRENRVIPIHIVAGKQVGPFAAGDRRILETAHHMPLHIIAVVEDEDDLVIKLANAGPETRVHLLASRFDPAYPLRGALGGAYDPPLSMITRSSQRNVYLSGRDIGDEYRYILERRSETPYPGNMLERPGLLLNPWEIRDTSTGKQQAQQGGDYADKSEAEAAMEEMARSNQGIASQNLADWSNLDFLKSAGVVLANLKPEKGGTLRIAKSQLGDRQDLHVVAIGATDMAFRHVSMPDAEAKFRDLRLATTLELDKHFTERKEVALLAPGDTLKIPDVRAAEMQEYDTLESIYSLYVTKTHDSVLNEFAFVLKWDSLTTEQQRAKYSKYASHELNFFLSRKDPEFFKQVVLPYLANKKDKTFLDHYLLEDDLSTFTEPWQYSRLNIAERVLLADRLGGDERDATKRALKELLDMIRPNTEQQEADFFMALRGRSLSSGGVAGQFEEAKAEASLVMRDGDADEITRFRSSLSRGQAAINRPEPTAGAALATVRPMDAPAVNAMERLVESRDRIADAEALADRKLALAKKDSGVVAFDGAEGAFFGYGGFGGGGRGAEFDIARRSQVRGFYRKMSPVKEWAENNYYHVLIENQGADRVLMNAFWYDYAKYLAEGKQGPFLSEHIAKPTNNFTEMMLALTVIDLPTKADKHEVTTDTAALELKAGSPMIVFHKQIETAPISDDKTPVLVGQNFFRQDDRFIQVDGQRRDKYVTDEFLPGVVYGCQVVVTNPTSATQKLDVLLQIPEKALPVAGSKRSQSVSMQLEPYATNKREYYFYFPRTGDFAHYPVHVARDEALAAWADAFKFHVVEQLSQIDKASWDYVSQWATPAEVMTYLEQHNLQQIDLNRIAWRMRDLDFFNQTIDLLADRHVYNPLLWSYSIHHNQLGRLQEYLRMNDVLLRRLGDRIDCTLVTVDPVDRRWIQHLEYSPLVNARAHRLGRDRKIVNSSFREQYQRVLNVLKYKAELTNEDKLDIVYYLFLQDRIGEALTWLDKVDLKQATPQLQLDYLQCYADFYREQPEEAATIAKKYVDYPVDKWRERFANVLSQAGEISGAQVADSDREEDDRETLQDQLASTEPALSVKVEQGQVAITYQNLQEATVNYYEMDLEFLFSSNPFVESEGQRFGVIKPNHTQTVSLEANGDLEKVEIPQQFAGKNVLVEVVAAGRRVAQPYYANNLKVQMVEQYGRLQVRHAESNQPLSKVYVKVYARTPEGPRFYKDGYTDLRGKFDYTSLNTDDMGGVSEFAVLVMSNEHGAIVKTAKPPQQ
ncbi:hypothetical protein [Aeoliella mucimassa]|uniref:MG2 domain protein n=1 Tax=Aeoliella mucimassa TaxID=2527972 RepID=A0A518AW70_9BACT|nr:hypothetical protein [Aeoliella mucimassa]QDU58972.1 hypothetical protein Pan181_52130 [Aeoliella mucimassa]